MQVPELHIQVPATSANLGPGFDIFGLAISRYGRYHFTFSDSPDCTLLDGEGSPLPIAPANNLIWVAYNETLQSRNIQSFPGFTVRATLELPISRGFGSSASALVAGLAAADHFLAVSGSETLSQEEKLRILIKLEGHPDNVFPALLGGWVFGYQLTPDRPGYVKKSPPPDLGLAIIIPRFEVSTQKSRTSLPHKYTMNEIKYNITGVCLWMEYLNSGDSGYLVDALKSDRIHETYRKEKIPGYDEICKAAYHSGCYGVSISGSGPGILLYYPRHSEKAFIEKISPELETIGHSHGQIYPLETCTVDDSGLQIIS